MARSVSLLVSGKVCPARAGARAGVALVSLFSASSTRFAAASNPLVPCSIPRCTSRLRSFPLTAAAPAALPTVPAVGPALVA